jgi:pimeloyl-ACP methyl ester carboxylesterase
MSTNTTSGTAPARVPSGRGKATLATDWYPASLPEKTAVSLHTLITHDGEVSRGTLYEPGTASRTVFCLMHPRQDLQRHPLIPGLLEAGHSVWTQAGREVGNDLRLVHETALLDVAAGMEFLRERGFEHIVLIGHSGGAGLYSFYAEQSLTAPSDRVARTPGGAPVKLGEAPMPAPDGLVLVAPHPGQGRLLLSMIDPSVTDEGDPFSLDPDLDLYNPANGFGDAPEGSQYSAEFVERYRAAQRDRVARIDERACELIAGQLAARKRFKGGSGDTSDRRRSVLTPIITTYRTDADPRCTDLSLDPSDRPYGSVISARPSVSNYGVNGFGRLTTPEAWLSTWSGLSSNASLVRSLGGVTIPTLVIEFTGDCSVFPSDVQDAVAALKAEDSTHLRIRADHFGRPLADGDESGIAATVREVVLWTEERVSR